MSAIIENNDEESFIILGSSPGTSLDLKCNGVAPGSESLDKTQIEDALKELSPEAGMAFKAHFNLGECPSPASLMMASTIISEDKSTEDLQKKFGEILDENLILKETLKQNNDSVKEQFLLIASCQEDMMKAHQIHKEKFDETRDLVEKLRSENKKLKLDITKLLDNGAASLRHSQINGETGEVQESKVEAVQVEVQSEGTVRAPAPSIGYEFVTSPDDDTLHKLTSQLELVEKQRRQVITENEKLTWQKESLEHIVDATSKERDELKEKIKKLELLNSNQKIEFENEIKKIHSDLFESQKKLESFKGVNNDELQKKDNVIQQLNSKISMLQAELKTSQLKVFEFENVKLEFTKQKSGATETMKMYRDQMQDLHNRLKEAQTTVFQPIRFSISSDPDTSGDCSGLAANVKLYDKTLKHLSDLLNTMTRGLSDSLMKTMEVTCKLSEYKIENTNVEKIRTGMVEIKQNLEKQHSEMLNNIGQVRGILSIFEGIFQDSKELLKNKTPHQQEVKQERVEPHVDALTAALLSRAEELHAAEKEIGKLRQMILTLQKESDERDLLKAQLDVYKTDFEAERDARQKMASEREIVFADLRTTQRRNQELVEQLEEARKLKPNIFRNATAKTTKRPQTAPSAPQTPAATRNMLEEVRKLNPNIFRSATAKTTKRPQTAPSAPQTPAAPSSPAATGNMAGAKKKRREVASTSAAMDVRHEGTPPPIRYTCPVCDKEMRSLKLLQDHVDNCLL